VASGRSECKPRGKLAYASRMHLGHLAENKVNCKFVKMRVLSFYHFCSIKFAKSNFARPGRSVDLWHNGILCVSQLLLNVLSVVYLVIRHMRT